MQEAVPPVGDAREFDDPVILARDLEAAGRVREAIDLLSQANRRSRSPRLERELVRVRHAGYDVIDHRPLPTDPPRLGHPFEVVDGMAQIPPPALDGATLDAAISGHGCALTRGLIPERWVKQLVAGIDEAFTAYDQWAAPPPEPRPAPSPWYSPFKPISTYAGRGVGGRGFTRSSGGIWTVDSPRMLFDVIEMFDEVGLRPLISDFMGEPPALSAAKCNLRRTPPEATGGWHQDGSFIGTDVCSLDVWIALTECGPDALGLDIVPHRTETLLETGWDRVVVPDDGVLAWVDRVGSKVVSPHFLPGDAVLFDHFLLHRTAQASHPTTERYALETWFFAPSRYPGNQIPIIF